MVQINYSPRTQNHKKNRVQLVSLYTRLPLLQRQICVVIKIANKTFSIYHSCASELCGGVFACANNGQCCVPATKNLNFVTGCYSLLHTQILGLGKVFLHT